MIRRMTGRWAGWCGWGAISLISNAVVSAHSRFVKWQGSCLPRISRKAQPLCEGVIARGRAAGINGFNAAQITAAQFDGAHTMTTFTLSASSNRKPASKSVPRPTGKNAFDLTPRMRAIVAIVGTTMTLIVFYAVMRGLTGLAPNHAATRDLAVMIHVATVIPAIPLGGYLLLARKGTKRHKVLGKVWTALMVITATAAIWIGDGFSFIHLFIPMTFWASYRLIATARAGDMKGHKKEVVNLYLYALMIPGVVSFAIPGRLMNTLLLA